MEKTLPAAWREHDRKVQPYIWSHRILSWTRSLGGLIFAWFWFFTPMGRQAEWYLNVFVSDLFLMWLAYFGVLALGAEILGFPLALAGYYVERRFGLSKQSVASWLGDRLKGLLLGAVLGTIALGLLYLSVTWFANAWWFVAATLLVLFSIGLAQLAPIVLIPIFFKLKPMDPGPLKDRLFALCRRFQVEVKDVYHLGLGEKTEKGNAAFVGLGRTKRILIGDTLYEKFPADQVEAVFAHELGHQVHNDLWKGIFLSTGILYIGFFSTKLLVEGLLFSLGSGFERPFGILVFFAVFSVIQWPVGVGQAVFSRWRERLADDFAAKTTQLAPPLADALERLTFQNWGLFKPNALVEFLTYSHPSPWRRILRLRS